MGNSNAVARLKRMEEVICNKGHSGHGIIANLNMRIILMYDEPMHLSLIGSLDANCRESAASAVVSAHQSSAVVFHDLLDGDIVLRRVSFNGQLVEHERTVLEHGCLSCTVRLDVVPTVRRLMDFLNGTDCNHIVLALPPGVAVEMAVVALQQEFGSTDGPGMVIDNALLAIDPADLEDQIWDKHTLWESGFTTMPVDERTAGEFLIGELASADSVMMSSPIAGSAAAHGRGWQRGVELLAQLAPHAHLVAPGSAFRPGCYDGTEIAARKAPGNVRVPIACTSESFSTVLHRVRRPLHPGRFRQALPQLAAGCTWMRGRLWLASAPSQRVAIQGIGPRLWMESTGPWFADRRPAEGIGSFSGVDDAADQDVDSALDWHPDFGDRGTVLALTGPGSELEPDQIALLLDGCQLTDEELTLDAAQLEDALAFDSVL